MEFVTIQAQNWKAPLAVRTSSFLLHAASLLSGKKATTHWRSLEPLRTQGDAEVVEQRSVQDGHIWSSIDVSAGTGLILAFIAHQVGVETAGKIRGRAGFCPSSTKYGSF